MPWVNNYYHTLNNGLKYVVTHMKNHKLNKHDTKLYIDTDSLNKISIDYRDTFLEIFENFITVTTEIPPHIEIKYIDDKPCDNSVLLESLESLSSNGKEMKTIIYMLRNEKRHVINDREIVSSLVDNFGIKYKIAVIDFKGMSFRTQIDAMNGCVLLVGCHGAGFSNTYFMHSGANVLELFPESFYVGCFEDICRKKSINHFYINGKNKEPPPISLEEYLSYKWDSEKNTAELRVLLREVPFIVNTKLVIDKMNEIFNCDNKIRPK